MKKIFITIVVTIFLATGTFAQTTWIIDRVHSNVKFSVSHLVISEVEGSFKVYSGIMQLNKPDFTDADVVFSVDVNSIDTDNEMRDKHLRSDDFFNAEQFPAMSFKNASWKKIDDQNYTLEGDLTIRNTTKRVTFDVRYGGTIKDPYGNVKAGFKASTVINRFDYGLKWNALTEAGGMTVGKEVAITLNLEFTQLKSS